MPTLNEILLGISCFIILSMIVAWAERITRHLRAIEALLKKIRDHPKFSEK